MHLASCIDITLASSNIKEAIVGWEVDLGICPASDHNAIRFTVEAGVRSAIPRDSTYKYNNKTANWEKFGEQINTLMRESGLQHINFEDADASIIEEAASKMTCVIQEACEASMKPRGKFKPHNPWWSQELEEAKKSVIKMHHRLSDLKKHGRPLAEALASFRDAKREYKKKIQKASSANFREFCNTQNKENVWSLTNRIIKDAPANQAPFTLASGSRHTGDAAETANSLLQHFYPDDGEDTLERHREL